MSYYSHISKRKQQFTNGDESEVNVLWELSRPLNNVDPLDVTENQEVSQNLGERIAQVNAPSTSYSSIPSASSNILFAKKQNTEYPSQSISNTTNPLSHQMVKIETIDIDSTPTPSPSSSILKLSNSEEEEEEDDEYRKDIISKQDIEEKCKSDRGLSIVSLVPELSTYINDNYQPDDNLIDSKFDIRKYKSRNIEQINQEKLLKKCKIVLYKLPDSLVEQLTPVVNKPVNFSLGNTNLRQENHSKVNLWNPLISKRKYTNSTEDSAREQLDLQERQTSSADSSFRDRMPVWRKQSNCPENSCEDKNERTSNVKDSFSQKLINRRRETSSSDGSVREQLSVCRRQSSSSENSCGEKRKRSNNSEASLEELLTSATKMRRLSDNQPTPVLGNQVSCSEEMEQVWTGTKRGRPRGTGIVEMGKNLYLDVEKGIVQYIQENKNNFYYCTICNIRCKKQYDMKKHVDSKTHSYKRRLCSNQVSSKVPNQNVQTNAELPKTYSALVTSCKATTTEDTTNITKSSALIQPVDHTFHKMDIKIPNLLEEPNYSEILKNGIIIFSCNFCVNFTKKRFHMERHVKKHKGDINHTLIKSDKNPFKNSEIIGYSEVTQNNTLSFQCNICKLLTKKRFYMERHIKTHTNFKLNSSVSNVTNATSSSVLQTPLKPTGRLKLNQQQKYNRKTYSCNDCDYKSEFQHNLKRHRLNRHSDSDLCIFKCEQCNTNFNDSKELNDHKSSHKINNEQYDLNVKSDKSDDDDDDSEDDYTLILNSTSYTCPNCGTVFKDFGKLIEHNQTVHQKGATQKNTSIISADLKQKNKVNSSASYSCNLCNSKFNEYSKLKLHRTSHLTGDLFNCDLCEYKTAYKSNLKPHMRRQHGNVKLYICQICNTSFNNLKAFTNHKLTHSHIRKKTQDTISTDIENTIKSVEKNEEKFECELCPSVFKSSKSYLEHKKTHLTSSNQLQSNVIYRHKCRFCNINFKKSSDILTHRRDVHMSGKFFKCKDCTYKSKNYYHVERHWFTKKCLKARKHIMFPCDECSKVFKSNEELLYHRENTCEIIKTTEIKLSGVKDLQCDKCEFKTEYFIELNQHKQIVHSEKHNTKKLDNCNICEYTSKHAQAIKRHIFEVHSSPKHHVCSVCNVRFKRKYALQLHMKQKHKNVNTLTSYLKKNEKIETKAKCCKLCNVELDSAKRVVEHLKVCSASFGNKKNNSNSNDTFCDESKISQLVRTNKIKRILCPICGINYYKSIQTLENHLKFHFDKKSYKCKHCSYIALNLIDLKNHLVQNHKLKKTRKSNANEHESENKQTFNCCICNLSLGTNVDLMKHMKNHVPDIKDKQDQTDRSVKSVQVFKCKICFKKFSNNLNLRSHMHVHGLGQLNVLLSCNLCNFKTQNESSLNAHKQSHNKDIDCDTKVKECLPEASKTVEATILTCPICKADHNDYDSFMEHMQDHNPRTSTSNPSTSLENNSTKTKNETRSVKYQTKINLRSLIQKAPLPENSDTFCEICNKNYSTKANLERHKNLHLAIKPFFCDECEYRANDKHEIKRHKSRSHPNKNTKSYKLFTQCQEKKASDSNSKCVNEDKYNCVVCNASLRSRECLEDHMKYHSPTITRAINSSKENPVSVIKNGDKFQCKICSGLYKKCNRKIHMLQHKNEKPFACDVCSFTAFHAKNLALHKRKNCPGMKNDESTSENIITYSDTKSSNVGETRTWSEENTVSPKLLSNNFECDDCKFKDTTTPTDQSLLRDNMGFEYNAEICSESNVTCNISQSKQSKQTFNPTIKNKSRQNKNFSETCRNISITETNNEHILQQSEDISQQFKQQIIASEVSKNSQKTDNPNNKFNFNECSLSSVASNKISKDSKNIFIGEPNECTVEECLVSIINTIVKNDVLEEKQNILNTKSNNELHSEQNSKSPVEAIEISEERKNIPTVTNEILDEKQTILNTKSNNELNSEQNSKLTIETIVPIEISEERQNIPIVANEILEKTQTVLITKSNDEFNSDKNSKSTVETIVANEILEETQTIRITKSNDEFNSDQNSKSTVETVVAKEILDETQTLLITQSNNEFNSDQNSKSTVEKMVAKEVLEEKQNVPIVINEISKENQNISIAESNNDFNPEQCSKSTSESSYKNEISERHSASIL